jgi:hypothetical protein
MILIKQQKPTKNSGECSTAAEFISVANQETEVGKRIIKEIQAIVQINRTGNPKKNGKVGETKARVSQLWMKPGRTPVELTIQPKLKTHE